MANTIVIPTDLGNAVVVGGTCYQRVGLTYKSVTNFTVDETVASCAAYYDLVNLVAPVIARVGADYSVTDNGSWSRVVDSFAYQWFVNGVSILGATNTTFLALPEYVNLSIVCAVTAYSTEYGPDSATSYSNAIPYIDDPPVNTVPPSFYIVVDTPVEILPQVAYCDDPGTWDGNLQGFGLFYQWYADSIPVPGQTTETWEPSPTSTYYGKLIKVAVRAYNIFGTSEAVFSDELLWPLAPINTSAPVISLTEGVFTLDDPGTWAPDPPPTPTYAYQWLRNGLPIDGATSDTYTAVEEDADQFIRCRVTATNIAGASDPADSNEILGPEIGIPVNLTAPVISLDLYLMTLDSPGIWYPAADSYAYQWLLDGAEIAGETGESYSVRSGDFGLDISCRVIATNGAGDSSPAFSNSIVAPEVYPSIILSVSGPSGTVTWCGETWNLPADSGVTKEVYPTTYFKGITSQTNGGTSPNRLVNWENKWIWASGPYGGTQLALQRFQHQGVLLPGETPFGTSWFNMVQGPVSGTVGSGWRDDFNFRRSPLYGPTIFGSIENDTGLGIITANYPLPTANDYAIGAGMFGSYFGVDGNTYTWQQGTGWS